LGYRWRTGGVGEADVEGGGVEGVVGGVEGGGVEGVGGGVKGVGGTGGAGAPGGGVGATGGGGVGVSHVRSFSSTGGTVPCRGLYAFQVPDPAPVSNPLLQITCCWDVGPVAPCWSGLQCNRATAPS
jgi:hypothetical protein